MVGVPTLPSIATEISFPGIIFVPRVCLSERSIRGSNPEDEDGTGLVDASPSGMRVTVLP
jgi:hypothetical protein